MLGDLDTHDHLTRALAAESGCAILAVDDRMFHGFFAFGDLLDDGRRAVRQAAHALTSALRFEQ